ncbi:hypothetical protein BDV27DRAFT_143631 [Aspergillus caelatus]|uniref:N-acetyltransferase domain-containing protein n=1 Tax=Aspergillus caelatus TaxID=61420 RepID=A0A5N7A9R2_9EURO|nr:uncharacterized protein BDV27DRAFT_143631 [Aspergillus caelatus]KAE8366455.1 hypothetical protein BDV27DRAFT_143631 [Aspergillus caelatus]
MAFKNWHRGDYLVSTDPDLLQVDAVNAALGSEMVWWAGDLPAAALQEALHSSLCLGLYQKAPMETPNGARSSSTSNGIGLVRVITDNVTFAYLTDVYILDGHRGSGLGRWVLEILNEKLRSWPHLRRVMLLTTDKMHLFSRNLGMKDYREFDGMKGVSIAMVEGPGAQH